MSDKAKLLKIGNLNDRSIDGQLLVEAVRSNPNGDPDNGGKPRKDIDDFGIISAVSIKRKIRDLIENPSVLEQAKAELGLSDKLGYEILESHASKGQLGEFRRTLGEMPEADFIKRFVDVRLFGCNLLCPEKKGKDSAKRIFRGAFQFRHASSVARINVTIQGITSKTGTEEGKASGMGPDALAVVDHGLYVAPFSYRPIVGQKSGTTTDDIKLLFWLLSHIYDEQSVNRVGMNIRQIIVGVHENRIGSFNPYEMYDAIKPVRKGDDKLEPSRSMADYDIPGMDALSGLTGEFYSI